MSTIKDLCKQNKVYWICVVLTVVLSYGFTLTNFSIGVDDEKFHHIFFEHGLLAQGRWGYVPLRSVFNSYLFLPFWRDFLALILMVTGLTFMCGVFRKYSEGRFDEKAATIFTCLALSFSYIAHLFIFMMATIEIGLILILTGLTMFCFAKWALEKACFCFGILGALFLGYAIAFFETALFFYLIGTFSLLLLAYIHGVDDEASKMKSFLLVLVKLVATVIGGVVIWFLGGLILQRLLSIDTSGYVGGHVYHDTSSLAALLQSVVRFAIRFPVDRVRATTSITEWLLLGASLAVIAVGIVYAVIRRRISIFLVAVGAVVSAYGMHVLLGQVRPPYRISITFSILIGFCVALAYIISSKNQWKKFNSRYLVVFATVWMVFYQSRVMNQIFFMDYQRYQHDVMLMHTIIHDLDGLQKDYPILFIGMIPTYLPRQEVAGNSIFNWDRSSLPTFELYARRIHLFFRMHGFPILHPGEIDEQQLRYYLIGMENWPREGYIRRTENFVVVKLGPSFFEP